MSLVKQKILSNDSWYVDDQFAVQLGNPGSNLLIQNRWRFFEQALRDYVTFTQTPVRILDAGCGDGINLFGIKGMLERNSWKAFLYGTDYNPLRVERVIKVIPGCDVQEANLLSLPFEDGFFDVILCNHVLEHISDDVSAILELKRVLKSDGILMLGVPNEGCFIAQFRNRVVQPSISRTTDHVHFYTRHAFTSKLVESGFLIERLATEGFFFPHLRINNMLKQIRLGRYLTEMMRRMLPSQSAGLMVLVRKQL